MLVLTSARGALLTRDGLRRLATMLGASVTVWVIVRLADPVQLGDGPGTTPAQLKYPGSDLAAIAERFCFDWQTLPPAIWKLFTLHWPMLFGTKVEPLLDYAVNSHLTQGMRGGGLVLATAAVIALVRVGTAVWRRKGWDPRCDFCAYLFLVGALSVNGVRRGALRGHLRLPHAVRNAVDSGCGRPRGLVPRCRAPPVTTTRLDRARPLSGPP